MIIHYIPHERHMELVDAVNNAKTKVEHDVAYWKLQGWRDGVRAAGLEVDGIAADLEQIHRGFGERPMTCGVFHDWKESK